MSGLRVALVGGPMYDRLYQLLPDDVDVVVHASHPDLNREVARRLADGDRIDVLSTHCKYAPSQALWLTPLEELVEVSGLAPAAVDLCRVDGALLCVPRNIDVRLLWVNRDMVAEPPSTWDELEATAGAFGFPGRESGLFGTFFELVIGSGGDFYAFDDHAVAAVERLVRTARKAPADLPGWHYDEVDAALGEGRVAMAAAWPGATAALRASRCGDQLVPHRYPAGSARWVSYAGCHAWAIPTTCGDVAAATALVAALTGFAAGRQEAASGAVTAHVEALATVEPTDALDARRWAITQETVDQAMITYPPHPRFPELEDAGSAALRAALMGETTPRQAVAAVAAAADRALGRSRRHGPHV